MCAPSSTTSRGRAAATTQWAKGTCPYQALSTPSRVGRRNGGSSAGSASRRSEGCSSGEPEPVAGAALMPRDPCA